MLVSIFLAEFLTENMYLIDLYGIYFTKYVCIFYLVWVRKQLCAYIQALLRSLFVLMERFTTCPKFSRIFHLQPIAILPKPYIYISILKTTFH